MTTADHGTSSTSQRRAHRRGGKAALGALGAALLLAACGSSGSKATSGATTTTTSGTSASGPVVGSSPHTFHYFSKSVLNELFHADGSRVTDQNEAPKAGDYFVSANTDYAGDHLKHSSTPAGSDHITCVIQSVGEEGGAAICDGEAAFGGSLIVVDHQPLSLSQGAADNILAITGGTGRYKGVKGQVESKSISANSDDSDFDITISGPTGAAGSMPDANAPVPSANGTTPLRYYQKADGNAFYTPDGKVVTDQNSPPQVGDYVVSTDLDYVGDHLHHATTAVATDHIVCLITTVTASGGTGDCDGEFAFGGSMFYADHQTITFADNANPVVRLTGGTGKLQGVSGSIKSTSVGNTDDSDIVVTLKG